MPRSLLDELIADEPPGQIAFFFRQADLRFTHQLPRQIGHLDENIAHLRSVGAGVNDVEHLPIEIRAGILLAHGGNDGDLQFRLNRGTKRACGHPIAAGLKAWTTDKQICFCVANLLQRRGDHRCQIFHGVIVAAYKGHRDFGIGVHDLLKKFPRTGSALADL